MRLILESGLCNKVIARNIDYQQVPGIRIDSDVTSSLPDTFHDAVLPVFHFNVVYRINSVYQSKAYIYALNSRTDMYRFFFRFVVTTITILTANLLTTAISDYMVTYKYSAKPLTFTLMGMGIIVIIFYPLFLKLEDWVTRISVKLVKSGHSLAGKYLGLFLVFVVCLFILSYFYARMWYHIDIVRALFNGTLGSYI